MNMNKLCSALFILLYLKTAATLNDVGMSISPIVSYRNSHPPWIFRTLLSYSSSCLLLHVFQPVTWGSQGHWHLLTKLSKIKIYLKLSSFFFPLVNLLSTAQVYPDSFWRGLNQRMGIAVLNYHKSRISFPVRLWEPVVSISVRFAHSNLMSDTIGNRHMWISKLIQFILYCLPDFI